MTPAELDQLAVRANRAGFDTIPDYAASLEQAMWQIESITSHGRRIALNALLHPPPERAA